MCHLTPVLRRSSASAAAPAAAAAPVCPKGPPHAAAVPGRPKHEFYLAAILRATHAKQLRFKGLIYCAEDSKFVQVGLTHIAQSRDAKLASEAVMDKIAKTGKEVSVWMD